ncbi:hypothetical protein F2P81_004870 [Scophthalmus maximus]|uniref:Uncharacterized protein n=1 Tax=Scophthalmus maximus TaxID=52904 RepID=A0A6A4TC02_SCOMX|nr:hypothetical protein F2P81_004870 [Scophthalmus maximus]
MTHTFTLPPRTRGLCMLSDDEVLRSIYRFDKKNNLFRYNPRGATGAVVRLSDCCMADSVRGTSEEARGTVYANRSTKDNMFSMTCRVTTVQCSL